MEDAKIEAAQTEIRSERNKKLEIFFKELSKKNNLAVVKLDDFIEYFAKHITKEEHERGVSWEGDLLDCIFMNKSQLILLAQKLNFRLTLRRATGENPNFPFPPYYALDKIET